MNEREIQFEEKILKAMNGMGMLILTIALYFGSFAVMILGFINGGTGGNGILTTFLLVIGISYACLGWIPFLGLKILKPQEALVLTLFGKYIGTLKGEGFFYVNPFVSAVNPTIHSGLATATEDQNPMSLQSQQQAAAKAASFKKTISLKALTLNNNKQKVNDEIGRAHV